MKQSNAFLMKILEWIKVIMISLYYGNDSLMFQKTEQMIMYLNIGNIYCIIFLSQCYDVKTFTTTIW